MCHFSSCLEKKQLNSKDSSTQKTLQAWEGTALSLQTLLTVPTTQSNCASSTTPTELPETQEEVRETQHYCAVPEAEAARGGTHQKCLFHKCWDFRHWNLYIGMCFSGKWGIHPWEHTKDMDAALGIWLRGERRRVGLTVGLDDNRAFFQLKSFEDSMIAARSNGFGCEWCILYRFSPKLNVKIL